MPKAVHETRSPFWGLPLFRSRRFLVGGGLLRALCYRALGGFVPVQGCPAQCRGLSSGSIGPAKPFVPVQGTEVEGWEPSTRLLVALDPVLACGQ